MVGLAKSAALLYFFQIHTNNAIPLAAVSYGEASKSILKMSHLPVYADGADQFADVIGA
jgi:hypothetical protein